MKFFISKVSRVYLFDSKDETLKDTKKIKEIVNKLIFEDNDTQFDESAIRDLIDLHESIFFVSKKCRALSIIKYDNFLSEYRAEIIGNDVDFSSTDLCFHLNRIRLLSDSFKIIKHDNYRSEITVESNLLCRFVQKSDYKLKICLNSEKRFDLSQLKIREIRIDNAIYGECPVHLRTSFSIAGENELRSANFIINSQNNSNLIILDDTDLQINERDIEILKDKFYDLYTTKAIKFFYGEKSPEVRKIISKNLRYLRLSKGLNLNDSAKKIKISPSLLQDFESGNFEKSDINKLNFNLIEEYYQIEKNTLLSTEKFMFFISFDFINRIDMLLSEVR